jgi:hypothetical protein
MPGAPSTPTNFNVIQGNRQVLAQWDFTTGATAYIVQKSTDQINYSTIATVSGATQYLDSAVVVGVSYWYQVAASNTMGSSPYAQAQQVIPTPTSEVSLAQLILMCQQRADRVNSNFVTKSEWTSYINQSLYELYDLLITADEEYYVATPCLFFTSGNIYMYPMPDGVISYTNGITNQPGYIAPPFYKLKGVDLGINNANNAWVTVSKFNFMDRNTYVYPNSASTIYGVFNCQYRLVGNDPTNTLMEFIPTPSANQPIRVWYIPRLPQLLQDTDLTTSSISGWIEYVIVDAAIKALQKEESDVSVLALQKAALQRRIEETADNRDAGRPDTVTNVRMNGQWGTNSGGYGNSGPVGGY